MAVQSKMIYRGPGAVFFLPLVTFNIYTLAWYASTRGEMKRLGADVPTTWLIIVPFANLWWFWKYSEGVEYVTDRGMSTVSAFLLLILLGSIGMAIVQDNFNTIGKEDRPQEPAPPTLRQLDPATQLQRLHALKQKGAITPAEYDAKKKQLLGL